ncbi:MAG: amidohydrolase [Oligoflexus sp.]|nr:amidohydrolase [Oligoflexus sp.]
MSILEKSLLPIFAACLSLSAQAGDKTYLGMPIKAVDIHMHPGTYENMGPIGKKFVKSSLPDALPDFLKNSALSVVGNLMLDPYGAFIGIKGECEKAGLELCGLFAIYAPQTWGVASNEYVIGKLSDKKNRKKDGSLAFFGLASVRMQDWNMGEANELANLRKALSDPRMKGIKMAFIHNNIPLDDAQYDSIYQVADELQVPVYHHVGSSPLQKLADFNNDEEQSEYIASYDPSKLERAIVLFPKVKFILGHMGFDFNKEGYDFSSTVYDLAAKYPNVYLEISAFGRSAYDPEGKEMDKVLFNIKQKNLIGRTIYGSDGPGFPGGTEKYMDATLRSLERTGYSYEEAAAVLRNNSFELFKLDTLR